MFIILVAWCTVFGMSILFVLFKLNIILGFFVIFWFIKQKLYKILYIVFIIMSLFSFLSILLLIALMCTLLDGVNDDWYSLDLLCGQC